MLEDLNIPQILTNGKIEILAIGFAAVELNIILAWQLPNFVQAHIWLELLVLQIMMQVDVVLCAIEVNECCAFHDIYLNICVFPQKLDLLCAC